MADNFTANPGSGGAVFAADDLSGVLWARIKAGWGADGAAGDTSVANPFPIQIIPLAGSGCSIARHLSTGTSADSTLVKNAAGTVYAILATNVNAAVMYLKFYNKATAPTVGTDTPVMTLAIPGNAAGAGFMLTLPQGIAFATGIGIGLTTAIADNSTAAVAANEIIVTVLYI